MQTEGVDDRTGKRFAADSSSSRSVGFVEDGNGDVMALPGLEAAASAMNFMQNVQVGAGEMIDVEQIMQFNRRFTVTAPALQLQTGFQSSSLPVAAFYRLPLYPINGRQSYINYNMASCDLSIGSSSGATFPTRKRKSVSQGHMCCSTVPDGSKNPSFEMVPMHIWGCNAFGLASIMKQSLSPSLEDHAGCWNLENLDTSGNDKVVAERAWTMILRKELRNSDVGSLGRIVLPKGDAEANLPPLSERNGVILLMEDMISPVRWEFKYRYWPNNRSRMYVMQNTGGFVRSHKLQTGDFFIIYKEEVSGKYIVRGKRGCRHSFSANQVEQNSTLKGDMEGGVGAQQPMSNTEMRANLPPSPDPSTSIPTGNLFISNAEATATSMGPPYNVEGVSGGSIQFTPSFSVDTFVDPLIAASHRVFY
ncbi:hypothetical protein AAC387_Pa01g0456 [Persea americana]